MSEFCHTVRKKNLQVQYKLSQKIEEENMCHIRLALPQYKTHPMHPSKRELY